MERITSDSAASTPVGRATSVVVAFGGFDLAFPCRDFVAISAYKTVLDQAVCLCKALFVTVLPRLNKNHTIMLLVELIYECRK